jgi:site-specific recombinase XerD
MIDSRSASTALNKYKGVQQFFNYLLECEEIDRHPMEKLSQPDTPDKLVPVVSDDELSRLLETCRGKNYRDRRDMAIIRLFLDTGARLTEVANLKLADVDLRRDGVLVQGREIASGSFLSANAPAKPSAATSEPAAVTQPRTARTCSLLNADESR